MIDDMSCAIGFSVGRSLVSKGIQLFTKPDNFTPSHVYLYLNRNLIIETHMFKGVRIRPAGIYDNIEKRVYVPTFLSPTTKINMCRLMLECEGQRYGLWKVPLFALDGLFNTYYFTSNFDITNFKLCSQLTAWGYQKAPVVPVDSQIISDIAGGIVDHPEELDYKFGCNWKSCNPNHMQNYVDNHNDWKLIPNP